MDKEEHCEFSPSSFPMWVKCPNYESREDGDKSRMDIGTAQHEYLSALFNSCEYSGIDFLSEEEINGVHWTYNYICSIADGSEIKNEYKVTGILEDFSTFYGTVDTFFVKFLAKGGIVYVIDYKSGIARDYDAQLMAYAFALMQEFSLQDACIITLYGMSQHYSKKNVTIDECSELVERIINSRKENIRKRNVCSYCSWCEHKFNCVLRNGLALDIIGDSERKELKNITSRINLLTCDNDKLGLLGIAADLIVSWCDDVKKEIKKRLNNGDAVTGWEYKSRSGSKVIDDIPGAIDILKTEIDENDIMSCASLSLSKIIDVYRDTKGGTKKACQEKVEGLLLKTMSKTEDTKYLSKKKVI